MSEATVAEGTATAGSLLRDARVSSGMHIAALAVALKVPVSKLEALEADNYALLPDTVFVRALASSVCRTLKIDPRPVMERLPRSESPRLASDSAGINAPVKVGASRMSAPSSTSWSSSKSVSVVVLALLAGAVALVYYPQESSESRNAPAADMAERPVSGATPTARSQTDVGALPAADAHAAATGSTPTSGAGHEVDAAVRSAVAAPPAGAPEATASQPQLPSGILVLRARGETWVQVKDSAGSVVLQRNLLKGETVAAPGSAPYSVVVGRADVTDVLVRGVPFEVSAVSRENVARFEVK